MPDDANDEESELQIARLPSEADQGVIEERECNTMTNGNANGEQLHVVGSAAFAHSATAAIFTDSAAAIMREQVLLKVEINEEDPDTMNIQILARREFILFALELPEDEELPPTCWDRCCTGSRDPCHACTVQRVFITKNLQRARSWGIEIIRGLLFPLFSRFGSEVFSTISLFIAALSVILALPTFIRDAKEDNLASLEIVRLATSLAFLLLAILDFAYTTQSYLLGRAALA